MKLIIIVYNYSQHWSNAEKCPGLACSNWKICHKKKKKKKKGRRNVNEIWGVDTKYIKPSNGGGLYWMQFFFLNKVYVTVIYAW